MMSTLTHAKTRAQATLKADYTEINVGNGNVIAVPYAAFQGDLLLPTMQQVAETVQGGKNVVVIDVSVNDRYFLEKLGNSPVDTRNELPPSMIVAHFRGARDDLPEQHTFDLDQIERNIGDRHAVHSLGYLGGIWGVIARIEPHQFRVVHNGQTICIAHSLPPRQVLEATHVKGGFAFNVVPMTA